MTAIHELQNQIYVSIPSRNHEEGRAIAWMDYGPDTSLMWIVIMQSGEVWIIKNEDIRVEYNYSMDYPTNKLNKKR